jgi:hypothetical protein
MKPDPRVARWASQVRVLFGEINEVRTYPPWVTPWKPTARMMERKLAQDYLQRIETRSKRG